MAEVELTKRRRNQKGEGSRLGEELIQAAMRILDRAPSTQLSLRMVAREAGVAAPSAYPHFSDAQAMMTAIVHECWRQMAEEMSQAVLERPNADPLDELKVKMAAFVHYAMARPSRYQLLFALQPIEQNEEGEGHNHLRPVFRQVFETVNKLVMTGGGLPTDDASSSALLAISIAHGRIGLAHLAPNRAGNRADRVESYVADLIDRLFRPQPQ